MRCLFAVLAMGVTACPAKPTPVPDSGYVTVPDGTAILLSGGMAVRSSWVMDTNTAPGFKLCLDGVACAQSVVKQADGGWEMHPRMRAGSAGDCPRWPNPGPDPGDAVEVRRLADGGLQWWLMEHR